MRRILVFVVVVALAVVMAVPAFAASETGNCVGKFASQLNQGGKNAGSPGVGGKLVAEDAQAGGVDETATNCEG